MGGYDLSKPGGGMRPLHPTIQAILDSLAGRPVGGISPVRPPRPVNNWIESEQEMMGQKPARPAAQQRPATKRPKYPNAKTFTDGMGNLREIGTGRILKPGPNKGSEAGGFPK
jgi:hypothetical protein